MSDFTFSPQLASTAMLRLLRRQDHSLYQEAAARWRDSREELHALVAQAPGVRDSIEHLLKEQLQLGTAPAGLGFLKTEHQDEHAVSLADAWAFICQFPDIPATLNAQSTVVGLALHRLSSLTPVQLLQHLKALNLAQLLTEHWNQYWSSRAPGTPLSRADRAAQLYRQHFEACSQLALATGNLSAAQLKPLQPILNLMSPPNGAPAIETWQLALVLPGASKVKLPGAWLITEAGKPLLTQTLYLPCRKPTLVQFSQRSEMEHWLTALAQQLIPPDVAPSAVTFDYSPRNGALEHGVQDLLSHLHTAQLESLRNRHRNGSDLGRYAGHALDDADQLDRQRRENPLLAAPPGPDLAAGPDDDDQPALFGQLSADIALSERLATVKQQRSALEAFLGDDQQWSARLASLKPLMQALDDAEQAANTAASALLDKRGALQWLELRHKPNADYDVLYHARLAALRAEAALQQALKQISADEQHMLQAVLDHPDTPANRADVAVARLILTSSDTTQADEELHGLLLFTQTPALTSAAPHSLLLYWPGVSGGLQRFASRQALEQALLKLSAEDLGVTLQWSVLTGNPFEYSLQQQLYASEQQAVGLIKRYPAPAFATELAEAMGKLHAQTLFEVQAHHHPARELAYGQLLQQQRSSKLASALPTTLSQLSEDERGALKALLLSQIKAMQQAEQLLQRDLEPFQDFSQRRLDARLREDLMLEQPFEVQLDLPDSVSQEREYLSAYAGPGTPFKYVTVASQGRGTLSLLQLAQQNIDQPLAQRLSYMKVNATGSSAIEVDRLTKGLTLDYLKVLVKELDLAGAYEQLITHTFLGAPTDPPFATQYRRECLTEPLRLMLALHGKLARAQGLLNDTELQILNIAIDATDTAAWQVEGKRIVLLPAHLSAGGKDTDHGPTTLAGVTFIQEQQSGVTLLYLPDIPDGRHVRRYASLDLARKALYDLSLGSGMSAYFAGLAIKGDTQAHLARLAQAQLKNFDGMFAVGPRWPVTTSLAGHLLNARMGRLIEAHRATSRSNAALLLEQNALRAGLVFNYLKIALGLVPFAGSVIALYDAWTSANLAVANFLRGDVGHGLAEVEGVLLALIDCAMDVLPGSIALPVSARGITRQRQLRSLGSSAAGLQVSSISQSRRAAQRFAGYEYEGLVSLAEMQPHAHGLYRQVYRHATGDFIVRRGRIHQVELAGDPPGWRLSGTPSKTYKQPITLDENGEWDTHFGVYGVAFNGGLVGGGGVLGHMAERLDPLWPHAIRERLPVWWTDRALRQQLRLQDESMALGSQVSNHIQRARRLGVRYMNAAPEGKTPAWDDLRQALRATNDLAIRHDHVLQQLPQPVGRDRINALRGIRQANAAIIARNTIELSRKARLDLQALVAQFSALALDHIDAGSAINLLNQRKTVSVEVRKTLEDLDQYAKAANAWHHKIRNERDFQYTETNPERLEVNRKEFADLSKDLADLNNQFGAEYRRYLKFSFSLETFYRYDAINDLSWFYLHQQVFRRHLDITRALQIHYTLGQSSATRSQRAIILEACILEYQRFSLDLKAWNLGYPQHFDQPNLGRLLDDLDEMVDLGRQDLGLTPARPQNATFQVFTTEDHQLMVGTETAHPQTHARQFIIETSTGQVETWHLDPQSNRARLATPTQPPPVPDSSVSRNTLVQEAQSRLNDVESHQTNARRYASQNMAPVNLEHLLIREAGELTVRANRIHRVAPDEPIIELLRSKADELTVTGRKLRIEQSMISKTPTSGYLDYLLTPDPKDPKPCVRLSKIGERIANGRRQGGRSDFLQEYAVHDLSKPNEPVLWYVHAHYDSATTPFDAVVKAHLKLPEQRNLGLEWQKQQTTHTPIWRGDISRALFLKHFASL
ncbi:hypothetical protein RGV33_26580 [Pseudomonas sp. Bout1]|uniref:dermonecrotic toxin domain-containing protein n=2 Tax=Pseudomonas sp. Bout1 TaxID=3048600 RepID=UPI002AB5D1F6|nr:DUF6543 domain-containing protein [Pseudomonas sp. Bout1]MDY7535199.1 hypothetical protein [Pseudomonas sp. Bout1]